MVDFICIGLVELQGTRREGKLQTEKFLQTVGFDFRLEAARCNNHYATGNLLAGMFYLNSILTMPRNPYRFAYTSTWCFKLLPHYDVGQPCIKILWIWAGHYGNYWLHFTLSHRRIRILIFLVMEWKMNNYEKLTDNFFFEGKID